MYAIGGKLAATAAATTMRQSLPQSLIIAITKAEAHAMIMLIPATGQRGAFSGILLECASAMPTM